MKTICFFTIQTEALLKNEMICNVISRNRRKNLHVLKGAESEGTLMVSVNECVYLFMWLYDATAISLDHLYFSMSSA